MFTSEAPHPRSSSDSVYGVRSVLSLQCIVSDVQYLLLNRRSVIAVHIMSWYLTCPQCGEQGPSGIHNRRGIFSPSQRVYKQVVLKTGNVNQNCCKKCNADYYLAEPSNQAYAPSPRPPMPNTSQPSPNAIFVPEVSDEEFTIHWLACKALFPASFWKLFHKDF